jgi:chemotaxis protein methyltransferase CheR
VSPRPAVQAAVLTDAEFAAVRSYLQLSVGLVFDDSRRAGLASSLAERFAAIGCADVATYLRLVQSAAGLRERQLLFDTVTVQETHFFRNIPQMEALRRHVLPELLRRCVALGRPLRIWSAGCSTGEEPYTLAMLATEAAGTVAGGAEVQIRVLGTDVSAAALATATQATYSGRAVALVDAASRLRWFRDAPGGALGVRPEIRRLVELRQHNLVGGAVPTEPASLDLVVCRNVTIYFDRDTTRALIERFHAALLPGGYLMLGHSETLWQLSDAYTLMPFGDAFAYRKDPVLAPARRAVPARLPVGRLLPGSWRPPEAAAPATRVVPARPVVDPVRDLALARAALASGKYSEAVNLASRAAAANPFEAASWTVQGQALATLGRDAEALVALRKAVYLDPAAGDAQFLLAGALARVGEVAGAGRAYRAAAATLPRVQAQVLAGLLDGRDVSDLVEMCRRLADAADRMRASGGVL